MHTPKYIYILQTNQNGNLHQQVTSSADNNKPIPVADNFRKMNDPRPSLARTSMSSQATRDTVSTSREEESSSAWEYSDIRGDVDAGWGGGRGMASAAAAAAPGNIDQHGSEWGWKLHPQALRPVPPFVPLDSRSTRRLFLDDKGKEMEEIAEISQRISSACQHLSIHANWDDRCPSATLVTMEMVEMVISVYLGSPDGSEGRSYMVFSLLLGSMLCHFYLICI